MERYRPKSNIIFGDVNLKDYNAFSFGCHNLFERAERDVDIISVPGRQGDLVLDNGRYKNLKREYQVQCTGLKNIESLMKKLSSMYGYYRLEDEYDEDVFYAARLSSKPDITHFVGDSVSIKLTFDRKPQRWLKSGENIAITGTHIGEVNWGSTLACVMKIAVDNMSADDSLPRIYIPGNQPQNTWSVWAYQSDEDVSEAYNGMFDNTTSLFHVRKVMTYSDDKSFIEVDSESRTITHGSDYDVSVYKDEYYRTQIYSFAKLKPGLNYFYFEFAALKSSGSVYPTPKYLKSPKVYPRWWEL